MLKVNIATRPFYNERGVHLLLALVALLLVLLTSFSVSSLTRLSVREAELTGRISQEERRAQDLRQQAAKLRSSVNPDELNAVLVAAREANGLIDQRTFSWTALFNHLEATLPEDVMLTAVRPTVDRGQVTISLGVVGRRVDAIEQFMSRLEATGAFRNVLSRDEQTRDDGTFEAILTAFYVPVPPGRASVSNPTPEARMATP